MPFRCFATLLLLAALLFSTLRASADTLALFHLQDTFMLLRHYAYFDKMLLPRHYFADLYFFYFHMPSLRH